MGASYELIREQESDKVSVAPQLIGSSASSGCIMEMLCYHCEHTVECVPRMCSGVEVFSLKWWISVSALHSDLPDRKIGGMWCAMNFEHADAFKYVIRRSLAQSWALLSHVLPMSVCFLWVFQVPSTYKNISVSYHIRLLTVNCPSVFPSWPWAGLKKNEGINKWINLALKCIYLFITLITSSFCSVCSWYWIHLHILHQLSMSEHEVSWVWP